MKLFLDANVVLDVLAAREPYLKASAQILGLVERGKVKGFIAAHSVTMIHYLLSKHLTRKRAQAAIVQLLNVLQVASVDTTTIKLCLCIKNTPAQKKLRIGSSPCPLRWLPQMN